MVQVVNRYIDQGVAELVPGVLFVDEVYLILAHYDGLAFSNIQTVAICFALEYISAIPQ